MASNYSQILDDYDKMINRLQNDINAIRKLISSPDSVNEADARTRIFKNFCNIERLSEEFVLKTRKSYFYYGFPNYIETAEQIILDTYPHRIGFTERNWFFLEIPPIPVKKDKFANKQYIRDTVYCVLSRFFYTVETLPDYNKAFIVFRNLYDEDASSMMYDVDNHEYNQITNCIATYLLKDDSAEYLNLMAVSEKKDRRCTQIYLVPANDICLFHKFLQRDNLDDLQIFPTPNA